MKLRGIEHKKAEQLARSRNRAVIGRGSGNIIDIYMQRGQCIARLWPVSHIYTPSPLYQRTVDAVKREREIEKGMNNDDRIALKLRAAQSRYNWWEVLGKIVISREYHDPGSVRPCYFDGFSSTYLPHFWMIKTRFDQRTWPRLQVLHRDHFPRPGHYWDYAKHREAGLENTLRQREVWNPDFYSIPFQILYNPYRANFRVRVSDAPSGSLFKIITYKSRWYRTIVGESGLYVLTKTVPWWLDAPVNPG